MTQLMLLGLIKNKAMSGYEIKQYLNLSHAEKWAGIQTGSIYYALKKLEEEELIEIKSVEHTGNRASTIYGITDKGKQFFKQLLIESFNQTEVNYPNSLYTSLTFLGELSTIEAKEVINNQIKNLKKELVEWEDDRKLKEEALSGELPEYLNALFDNGANHIQANIDLLEKINNLLSESSFELYLPPLEKNESKGEK